jgi:hypothetical protein
MAGAMGWVLLGILLAGALAYVSGATSLDEFNVLGGWCLAKAVLLAIPGYGLWRAFAGSD